MSLGVNKLDLTVIKKKGFDMNTCENCEICGDKIEAHIVSSEDNICYCCWHELVLLSIDEYEQKKEIKSC